MTGFRQNILRAPQICAEQGVVDVIISPGSRSAPLTLAFARHPQIRSRVVVDERAAAFVALGMARQKQRPVALICTSGTAALNYAPAVAEAFYQKIPLLLFTADRPAELLEQDDGQTIIQRNLYEPHCNASFELPVEDERPDVLRHLERILSESINACQWPVPGPVHVNVPLREPLYPTDDFVYPSDCQTIHLMQTSPTLLESQWRELVNVWHRSPKRLIVAGLNPPNPSLLEVFARLQIRYGATLLGDIASNVLSDEVPLYDIILSSSSSSMKSELQPDLLVSFGGPVVSKNLKQWLRSFPPKHHWHVGFLQKWPDPFQSLRTVIPMQLDLFWRGLVERLPAQEKKTPFAASWEKANQKAFAARRQFMDDATHSELLSMQIIMQKIPPNSTLHLGNSSVIRLASHFSDMAPSDVSVFSNRGTAGIDGTVSSAVGAAMASDQIATLIVGDLAFFYDRNGLWNSEFPLNLSIIVFNNGGGGIFRLLDGSRDQPELDKYFTVGQQLTAENVAKDHKFKYLSCKSIIDLEIVLENFWKKSDQPKILEIFFDPSGNSDIFLRFKKHLKESQ